MLIKLSDGDNDNLDKELILYDNIYSELKNFLTFVKRKTSLYANINVKKLNKIIVNGYYINGRKKLFKLFRKYLLRQKLEYNLKNIYKKIKCPKINNNFSFNTCFLKTKLYKIQNQNINWMNNIEENIDNMKNIFSLDKYNLIKLSSELYTDAELECFYTYKPFKNNYKYSGGLICDNSGMGKSLSIIALSVLRKRSKCEIYRYIFDQGLTSKYQIMSGSTLIICPPILVNHWYNEIKKHVNITLNVIKIISRFDLTICTYGDIIKSDFIIVSYDIFCQPYYETEWINYCTNDDNISDAIKNKCIETIRSPNILTNKATFLHLIYWNRIIYDEVQHIPRYKKYKSIINMVNNLSSHYKWCLSGEVRLNNMKGLYISMKILLSDYNSNKFSSNIMDYFTKNLVRKNNINSNDLLLPKIRTTINYINFSEYERKIYNCFLNMKSYDIFDNELRLFCCYPFVNKYASMKNCKTLYQLKEHLVNNNNKKIECNVKHTDKLKKKLNNLLKTKEKLLADIELGISINDDLDSHKSYLNKVNRRIDMLKTEINRLKKEITQLKVNINYCTENIPKIDSEKSNLCSICLSNILKDELSLTKCGHAYCYTCINQLSTINNGIFNCPDCRKELCQSDIFITIEDNKITDLTKLYGSKINALILIIRGFISQNSNIVIYSQWSELLRIIENIFNSIGINILNLARGNSSYKNKKLDLFKNNVNNKVLLLSSDCSLLGINLPNVNKIIFLDTIYKDGQFLEKTAINRICNVTNIHDVIDVIYLLIKNSSDEYIYKKYLEKNNYI